MQRDAYKALLEWKVQPDRKPLIIQGARQVGKTWLMKEFGRNEFRQTAYFNFESTRELHDIFKRGYDTRKILSALQVLSGFPVHPADTLIIFDEIQACPEAVTALKYFRENDPDYFIFGAGSLLGVAIHQGVSFPVGKVDFMTLHPLNFHEFLTAMGETELCRILQGDDTDLIDLFAGKYIELLKQYYFTGGMPEVVSGFVASQDYRRARSVQESILMAYENDFSRHAPVAQLPRIRLVWQSVTGQLARENSKFIYSALRTGARAKEFELAIEWLKDAGLIHKVTRISKPGLPLSAYADWSDFKIYLNDVGLLGALGGVPPETLLQGDKLFTEFKGTITEQFVLQQLVSQRQVAFYWTPDTGISEVDFVIQRNGTVVPVEVKAAENVRSRSLRVYYDKYSPEVCIRTSLTAHIHRDWMQNVPLYGFLRWLQKQA